MSSPLKQHDSPSVSAHPLQDLHDQVAGDMAAVNDMIITRLQSKVEEIPKVASYLIDSGGKRIRPLLTLGAAALAHPLTPAVHMLACAVEFIHSATLLHDDVVDESDTRRGKRSAHLVFGNETAVLVGDFLFSRAFELMVDTKSLPVLGLLSRASCIISEGEVLQLANTGTLDVHMDDYMRVITSKTAALFAAAAAAGPALYESDQTVQDALYQYGHHLGIAFQMADDVLDYVGQHQEMGKQAGNDFYEGKVTAPILFALQYAGETERAFWHKTIAQHDIGADDFEKALSYLHQHDAFSKTHHMALSHAQMAKDALAPLPDHPIKSIFEELAFFAAQRDR